jgi:hypothetical protein
LLHLPTNQPLSEESFSEFSERSRQVAGPDSGNGAGRRRAAVGGSPAPDRPSDSFGHYLQMARIERQISLEEISRRTRIGMDVLRAMEHEELDKLPAEVFVKGFLRSYAREVGVDGALAVQRYMASVHADEEKKRFNRRLLTRGNRFWKKLTVALFLFAALVAVSVMLVSGGFAPWKRHSDPAPVKAAAPRVNTTAQEQAPRGKDFAAHGREAASTAPLSDGAGTVSAKGRYLLKVLALEDTWMKVIADDRAPRRYRLHPGDRLELRASSGFNLLVGNAAGLKMSFNGRPINLYGKSGQTVTLQLP